MKVLVIDAQGGGIGKQLISAIKLHSPETYVMAVGTNSAATLAMTRAGADVGATGENSVVVACRQADIIVGPVGIVIADSMLGEVTPKMAVAIGQSNAKLVLIPFNHCDHVIAGVPDLTMGKLIDAAVKEVLKA